MYSRMLIGQAPLLTKCIYVGQLEKQAAGNGMGTGTGTGTEAGLEQYQITILIKCV